MSTSSPENSPARPPQVAVFGWLVIISGVVVVLSAWETAVNVRSLETTELLRQMLREPPFSAMSLEQLRQAHRISAIVAAAAAGGAAVFAVTAMRRDRSARAALTVLAVLVLLAGFVLGGIATTMLAVAAMMLWLQPSRDWFNGKEYVPVSREDREADAARPAGAAWAAPAVTERRADGDGTAPAPPPVADRPRPGPLLRACLLAGVLTTGMLVLLLISLLVLATDSSVLVDALRSQEGTVLTQQGITEQQLFRAVALVVGAGVLWCLAALAVTWLAFVGVDWARVTLLVMAAVSGLLALVASLATPELLLLALACALTVGQLVRPDVVAWTRSRGARKPRRGPMAR